MVVVARCWRVGLVGKALDRYNLHLGGNRIGTRIRMYKENSSADFSHHG